MIEHTSYYGILFENFIVLEFKKLIEYERLDWTLNYLNTKDDVEIDLVLTRPRNTPILVEIKSSAQVFESDIKALLSLGEDLDKHFIKTSKKICSKILISQDKASREIKKVECWHYSEFVLRLKKYI